MNFPQKFNYEYRDIVEIRETMNLLTLTFHVTDSILRQFNAFFLSILCSLFKFFLGRYTHNSSSVKSLKRSNLFLLCGKVHIGLETIKQVQYTDNKFLFYNLPG